MKKILLSCLFAASIIVISAQTNISIQIDHTLNGSEFQFQQTGTNNLNENFQVERLEYYLSGFSVTHDGGTVTQIENVYALVDASEPTTIELGSIEANSIESIGFYIGVDEENNHLDPASWPAEHPLAPKFPSMHWGWTSGYRFIAIEGDDLSNEIFQLHGLGDENYFNVDLPLSLDVNSEETLIVLEAKCEEILNNISIEGGLIVHGDFGMAQVSLENMASNVFFVTSDPLSVRDEYSNLEISIYPNPATNDYVNVSIDSEQFENYNIEVRNILGEAIIQLNQISKNQNIDLTNCSSGLYLLNLVMNGQVVKTEKLIVR